MKKKGNLGEIKAQCNTFLHLEPPGKVLIAQSALQWAPWMKPSRKETELLRASNLQRRGLNCLVKASFTKLHEPNVQSSKDFTGPAAFSVSQLSLYI